MTTRKSQNREVRQASAKERQEYWGSKTLEEQLKALDSRLGASVGAVKQRARLASLIEERNAPKHEKVKVKQPQVRRRHKSKKDKNNG